MLNVLEELTKNGKWDNKNTMKGGTDKGSGASLSSGIGGAIASGVKEIGGAILEAGKEAVVAGARSAIGSIL